MIFFSFLPTDNSDLIACTVITKDGGQVQRFLAVDIYQMSLVEPDIARLGWGVVKFAGLLQVRSFNPSDYFFSVEDLLLHWVKSDTNISSSI